MSQAIGIWGDTEKRNEYILLFRVKCIMKRCRERQMGFTYQDSAYKYQITFAQ